MSTVKYGILGGDYRYKILSELLIKDGYSVSCFNVKGTADTVQDISELCALSDIIVAPIPCSRDGQNLFLNGSDGYSVRDLVCDMDKNGCKVIIGGVMDKNIRGAAESKNIKVYDFFDMEEVAVLNAIPTAEGAVQTAMEESERTLFGSNALVVGFGRCGKILANMLKGIGARVSVTYRRESDRAYITAYGYEAVAIGEVISHAAEYSFIFNTVPAPVLGKQIIKRLNRDTVIIDLAQAPGGTDFAYAGALNIKALCCPGLPGRVAPYTAAQVLKDAVINVGMYGRQ